MSPPNRLGQPFLWLLLVLAFPLLMLSTFQKSLIYFPAQAPESSLLQEATRIGVEPWHDAAGSLIGWKSPAPAQLTARLLVFHGNAGFALHRTYFTALPPPGWQVYLFEYPGYGARAGSPDEKAIQNAASTALDELASLGHAPLFLAGESLGSGVASWLASQHPASVSGLILITPMTSLPDVAAHHYPFLPVRLLLTERYDSLSHLRAYAGPAAFVLAGRDEVIPPGLGQALHESFAGPKMLWEQPGAGHNTLDYSPAAWIPIFRFLLDVKP